MRKLSFVPAISSLAIIFFMHSAENSFNPIFNYISEYALGKYGFLASLSFSLYGVSFIALSSMLKNKNGENFLKMGGIALVIVGLFHCDPKRNQLTYLGSIHIVSSAIAFTGIILGFLSLKKKLNNTFLSSLLWIGIGFIPLLIIAIIGDFSYAYGFYFPKYLKYFSDYAGLFERILYFISIVWVLYLSTWLKAREGNKKGKD